MGVYAIMVIESKIIYKDGIPYKVTLEVTRINEGFIQNIKNKSENKKLLKELSFKIDKIIEPIQNRICRKYDIGKLIDKLGSDRIDKNSINPKKSEDFGILYSIIEDPFDKYDFNDNDETPDGRTYKEIFNKYKTAAEELEDELSRNKEFNQIATVEDLSVISDQIYTKIRIKVLKR